MNQSTRKKTSGLSIAIRNSLLRTEIKDEAAVDYQIEVANTLEKRMQSYHLVYESYLEKGFIEEASFEDEIYTINHDQFEETITFNAVNDQGQIAGTITLAFEDHEKLPMNKLFSEEIDKKRKAGLKICEVTKLVVNKRFRNSKKILIKLLESTMVYAFINKKIDVAFCEVHPHHKNFYIGLLGFEQIGPEKPCTFLNDSPAVCLALNSEYYINSISNNNHSAFKFYKYFSELDQALETSQKFEKDKKAMTENELWQFGFGKIEI